MKALINLSHTGRFERTFESKRFRSIKKLIDGKRFRNPERSLRL
ncbi:hypothetical protein [Maribacter sp. 2-571]